jgi:hypothetical protein
MEMVYILYLIIGFVMMKQQFLSLKKSDYPLSLTAGNMYNATIYRSVTVWLFYTQKDVNANITFNLSVNTSNTQYCPNNCSNNGNCNNGVCSCNTADSGYDCSINQQTLTFSTDTTSHLQSGQIAYYIMTDDLTSNAFNLTLSKSTDKNCSIGLQINQLTNYSVISIL